MYGQIQFGNVIFGNIPGTIITPPSPLPPPGPQIPGYRNVARLGDMCSCGAIIITGCSHNTFINNKQAALQGCRTSHNSSIMICTGTCIVNNRKLVRTMDMHSGCPIWPPHSPSPVIIGSHNVYSK
jgi:hypothetical protein